MNDAAFPIDPVLTGIVIAYRNQRYIADMVLPRLDPPLAKKEFKWGKWDLSQGYTIPNTLVGRKGVPTEVEFTGTEESAMCLDYGLDDLVPYDDEKQAAGSGFAPVRKAAESLYDLVLLDREKRVADAVFNAATYPTGNKATLSGSTQWSHADSDPITAVLTAMDAMLIRPNKMVLGRQVYTKFRTHPKVVAAVNPSGAASGVASKEAIADLLELEDIIVGEAFFNAAKPGQAMSRTRTWGKHAALIYSDGLADNENGRVTFGFTAQYDTPVSGSIPEPKRGLRGSERVRSGESVKEVICAPDVGYFFENAIA
ncbi:major capsid protein [Oceanibaculum indicum]|uniref:Phage capsid protein n=1 Tax=Oceanibaculum indicum P24 TaxID=1207063 RepID=K2JJZ9_9PROT|nr:hypothetical protein [Oceanibaculum indicum]EKE70889.1 phage capsid protein [Oceanibaculum indicum P24]